MKNNITGVVIMTYGSATTAEHVPEYMARIYKGKVPAGLVEDFQNRYNLVGHSPLVEITANQAALLQKELENESQKKLGKKSGQQYVVRSGMRHSEPFIEDAVRECREAGATNIVGIILSPQFSSFIMEGYHTALKAAAQQYGFSDEKVRVVKPWPTEPHFIELLASRVKESLRDLNKKYGDRNFSVPVIFTTHSLPERVAKQDPTYLDQLKATTDAVLAKLNVNHTGNDHANTGAPLEWYSAYQSAGHTPEAWLKPDLVDILAMLKDNKKSAVLIVPIQFLADHLEILYDLDIAAQAQCQEYGIEYHRIELPNTHPLFIKTLASLIDTEYSSESVGD